jgi:hypothetical protein
VSGCFRLIEQVPQNYWGGYLRRFCAAGKGTAESHSGSSGHKSPEIVRSTCLVCGRLEIPQWGYFGPGHHRFQRM